MLSSEQQLWLAGLSCCPGAAAAEELGVVRRSSRWRLFVYASGSSQPSWVPAVAC